MTDESITQLAIDTTIKSEITFCKFLSANDSGETGGHQSGILINNSAKDLMFTDSEIEGEQIFKKDIHIRWQNDFETDGTFTWYQSKHEFRLTRMGRGFPYLKPAYTGALFILAKMAEGEFEGFFFNTDAEIQEYLDYFGLSPAETNRLVRTDNISSEVKEKAEIESFIKSLNVDFPTSEKMSYAARLILYKTKFTANSTPESIIKANPDKMLIEWTAEEYRLFSALEHARYGDKVSKGFIKVDDFVNLANQVLNRRKSRAGKSLEHHLAAIFDANKIEYTAQGITEGNKKPDFVFPSIEAYHDKMFPTDKLCTLAAKTTCKDRWRQVLNEADRMRDQNKYLCTLQQGISAAQMDEMNAERVVLVVPKPYISSYPKDHQDKIWTIDKFVHYIRDMEGM